MLFASPSDNTQKAAEHLAIFCYEARRVLLPLPDSYESASEIAREEFSIPVQSGLLFETTELPVGGGAAVEIHPRTWKAISPILAQIYVRTVGSASDAARPTPEVHTPRVSATSQAAPAPTRTAAPVLAQAQSLVSPGREGQPAAASGIRTRPSVVPANGATTNHQPNSGLGLYAAQRQSTTHNGAASTTTRTFAARTSSQGAATPQATPARHSPSYATAEEEDERALSPRKGGSRSAVRKRVLSEDEDEGQSGAGSSQPQEVARKAPRARSRSISGAARMHQANGVPPTPLLNTVSIPADQEPATHHAPAKVVGPTETCLISVEYDNGMDVCVSTFKTKGRHTVHKVLLTVCKTFGIEAHLPRAELIRIVTDEDGDEIDVDGLEQRFVCPREHTMTQVGAYEEARFALNIQEDDTDTA